MASEKKWKKHVKSSIIKIKELTFIGIAETIFKMPDDPRFNYSIKRQELLLRSIIIRKQKLENII
jgi:hypothetical protein